MPSTTSTDGSSLSPIERATITTVTTRRRYTPDEKADAIAAYLADGGASAARTTGIPVGTIRAWASRGPAAIMRNEQLLDRVESRRLKWEVRRVDLAHHMGEVSELALQRCHQAMTGEGLVIDAVNAKGEHYDRIPNPSDAKNLALTMAILADKAQLLTGGATSRSEHATAETVAGKLAEVHPIRQAAAA